MTLGNFMIFGDSYSTFSGYIPEGFAAYYGPNRKDEPIVPTVDKTWWHMLCRETDSNLILNNSWSGSTVCHTGYAGDTSKTSSFVHRFDVLRDKGFFEKNKIDTVLIFGGTNDAWNSSPVGATKYTDFTHEELFSFAPAISYLISGVRAALPAARIVCIANSDISEAVVSAIRDAAEHFGVEYVKLNRIEKINRHPTVIGMQNIKDEIKAALAK